MAGPNDLLTKSFKPSAAVPRFTCVTLGGEPETVDPANAKGEFVIGVCQEEITAADVTDGRYAAVRVAGITYAVANAAIAQGAKVATQTNGKVATAAATEAVVGIAMNAATAADEWVPVLLTPGAVA